MGSFPAAEAGRLNGPTATSVSSRLARAVVPERLRPRVFGTLRSVRYRGTNVYCPCCDGEFKRFLAHNERTHARCPRCGALERHRLLLLYLRNRTNLFSRRLSLLHVAPEYAIGRTLRLQPNISYLSVDLESALAMDHADLLDLPYADGAFDVVMCNHVLEHVPDDRVALGEIHRVLKPSGCAIIMSPIDEQRERTLEDPSVKSTVDRARIFGQADHLRRYGRDFPDRVEAQGFSVQTVAFLDELDPAQIRREGLARHSDLFERDDIFICTREDAEPAGL